MARMKIRNTLKVLKLFTDNKDRQFTIKKVAEILDINYRIAYEESMHLKDEGLIRIAKLGNSNVCEFNYKLSSKTIEVEEIRKKELFRNKDILLVSKRIRDVRSPFYILALFGSYADKTNKKNSDIDLCLIADYPEINKEANAILSVTPLHVHLQEFTSKDFLMMLKRKELNVGNEIVRNNVILHGIEGFYELVNNAG